MLNSYSMILPANEIILHMTIGLKDLSNCITDDMITCNKGGFGQTSVVIMLFMIFPYFLMNIQRIIGTSYG